MKKLFVLILVAGLLLTMVPAAMAAVTLGDGTVVGYSIPANTPTGEAWTVSVRTAMALGLIDENGQPVYSLEQVTHPEQVWIISSNAGAAAQTPELGDSRVSTTVLALGALCLITGAVVARKKRTA